MENLTKFYSTGRWPNDCVHRQDYVKVLGVKYGVFWVDRFGSPYRSWLSNTSLSTKGVENFITSVGYLNFRVRITNGYGFRLKKIHPPKHPVALLDHDWTAQTR